MLRPALGRAASVLLLVLAITFQSSVPARAAGENGAVDERLLTEVVQLLERQYLPAPAAGDLYRAALDGILQRLDRHSTYLEPEQYEQFKRSLQGALSGIGVSISKPRDSDAPVTVRRVLEGTPAEAAGIRTGDRILAVNGEDVSRLDAETVASYLRGEPGTSVLVAIGRDGEPQPLLFHFSRREIVERTVTARGLPGGYGYIAITGFTERTPSEFSRAQGALRDAGVRGLVVDLRTNGGGLVDSALEVTARLVPVGPLMQVVRRQGPVQTLVSRGGTQPLPMAVLIGEETASAAELVAAALRDRAGAVLIGRRTFGKGSMQVTVPLSNGGALKFTFARFRSPAGHEIDGQGLTPDVWIEQNRPGAPAADAGGDLRDDAAVQEALRRLAAAPVAGGASAPLGEPADR